MIRGAATTNWHSLRLSFVKSCLDFHTNGKLPQQNSSSSCSDLLISTIYAAAKHPITHYKHCLPYRPTPPFFVLFFSLCTSYYSPRFLLCNPHKRIMAIIKWHPSLARPATNFLKISTFVRRFQFLHNRLHSSIPVKCHRSDVGVANNCCSKIFYAVS